MKLKQLCEAFDQEVADTFPDSSKEDPEVKGSGFFAAVKGDEDPFMINKVNKGIDEDPAYDAYVNNKLAQSNPHFPRIYQIQRGKKWKMEKLPFTLEEYLNTDDHEENTHRFNLINNIYFDGAALNDKGKLYDLVKSASSPIKLESYKKALGMIEQEFLSLRKSNKFRYDLHANNIMVRLTPQGPQLVITDPWETME
jgi:hypothetical protein